MNCALIARHFRSIIGRPESAFVNVATKAYADRIKASRQGRVHTTESSIGRTQSSCSAGGRFGRSFAGGQAVNSRADRAPEEVKPMEVEIKIRLPDRAAYDKVATALGEGRTASYAQANYFFDGPNRELNSRRVVLRLRTYNGDEKATITLKGKQILENGIGRASEVEEDIDPAVAARYLVEPNSMLREVPLIRTTAEKFGLASLVSLGGFQNQRVCYTWEGHVLELDETAFDHGTLYEIECETDHPEMLRDSLESFLASLGVSYSYSQTSKFANFINKTLL
ncbi:hypothetical protein Vretimale_16842 [Volvox reticuliferus]|uniref:CYTH domain-containing protein n=1 Tax=Volvox reticuliferus TaxID=1737510 RepID=A0A8J4LX75_9CHLO|nr:hypothetical protein Vretifemale_18450 [Volvox reticuliferus]GIM13794.1 hypothetical protein Vretimale_16842 [Volvox reticuliferus]